MPLLEVYGPLQLAAALMAALGSAFVRGLTGFGMAILLVPVLGLAIPPTEAVVTANWLGIFIGLVGLKAMLGASDRILTNGSADAWVFGSGDAPQSVPSPGLAAFALTMLRRRARR